MRIVTLPTTSQGTYRMTGLQKLHVFPLTLLFLALGLAALGAQGAAPSNGRTVWDGVYTTAQAERAAVTFNQACASCHTLSGPGNRSLVGDAFWESYAQKTVGDLLTYVSTSMP